jgi:2-polyprenyl-6-methoxyphenol hydroxylase-like FAD-dependent oxidoreductase
MSAEVIPAPKSEITEPIIDSEQTTCCIVGGGPGGMMLALLLARKGVPVTLLEAHKDFDRDFRGDTIHPSILEILDEIGLAEPLHKLRHVKVFGPTLRAANTNFAPFDFRRLKTKFPYIMLIPQTKFLEFIAGEAAAVEACVASKVTSKSCPSSSFCHIYVSMTTSDCFFDRVIRTLAE